MAIFTGVTVYIWFILLQLFHGRILDFQGSNDDNKQGFNQPKTVYLAALLHLQLLTGNALNGIGNS